MNGWPNFKSTLIQNILLFFGFFLLTFPLLLSPAADPPTICIPLHPISFITQLLLSLAPLFHPLFLYLQPLQLPPSVTPSSLLLLSVSPFRLSFTISSILHLSDSPLCLATQLPRVKTTHTKCLGCSLMNTDSHSWNVTGSLLLTLSSSIPPHSTLNRK